MNIPILQVNANFPDLDGVNSKVSVPLTGRIFEIPREGIENARVQPSALFVTKLKLTGTPDFKVVTFVE